MKRKVNGYGFLILFEFLIVLQILNTVFPQILLEKFSSFCDQCYANIHIKPHTAIGLEALIL